MKSLEDGFRESLMLYFLSAKKAKRKCIINTIRSIALCSNKSSDKDAVFMELCPNYIVKCGSTRHYSYQVFPEIASILGFAFIESDAAFNSGVKRYNRRWGKFISISTEAFEVCKSIASYFGSEPTREREWLQADVESLPRFRGGCCVSGKGYCPLHDDQTPSMVLWMNEDGQSGGAMCMVCHDEEGRPVTFGVRYAENSIFVSRALKNRNRNNIKPLLYRWAELPHSFIQTPFGSSVGAYLQYSNGGLYRTTGHRLKKTCILHNLLYADRRSKTDKSLEKAQMHSTYVGGELSYPVLSVSKMKSTGYGKKRRWSPASQRWLLYDFDDVKDFSYSDYLARGISIVANKDRNLSGRFCIVQTSKEGLHVWTELKHEYRDPVALFTMPKVRGWYSFLGKGIKRSVDRFCESSKLDMSSCAAGRFARRPSWRVDGGDLFRSKVVANSI